MHGSGMELPETHPNIGSLRVEDEGKLMTLRGTIIRTGAVLMLEGVRQYQCRKCKHRWRIRYFLDVHSMFGLAANIGDEADTYSRYISYLHIITRKWRIGYLEKLHAETHKSVLRPLVTSTVSAGSWRILDLYKHTLWWCADSRCILRWSRACRLKSPCIAPLRFAISLLPSLSCY